MADPSSDRKILKALERSRAADGGGGDDNPWGSADNAAGSGSSSAGTKAKANKGDMRRQQLSDDEDGAGQPKRGADTFKIWTRALQFVAFCTVLAALLVGAAHVVVLADSGLHEWHNLVTRTFGVLFSVLIIGTEVNLRVVRANFRVFEVWAFRGIFYFYIGVSSLEGAAVAYSVPGISIPQGGRHFVEGASWFLMGVGLLYIVLEFMCVRRWLGAMKRDRESLAADAATRV